MQTTLRSRAALSRAELLARSQRRHAMEAATLRALLPSCRAAERSTVLAPGRQTARAYPATTKAHPAGGRGPVQHLRRREKPAPRAGNVLARYGGGDRFGRRSSRARVHARGTRRSGDAAVGGRYDARMRSRARAFTPFGSSTARVHRPSGVRRRRSWSWCSTIAFHADHFDPGALPTVSPSRKMAMTASRARRRLVNARPPSAVSFG